MFLSNNCLTQVPAKKMKLEVKKLTSCETAGRISSRTGRRGLPHARRFPPRFPSQPGGAAPRAPAAAASQGRALPYGSSEPANS